MENLDILINRIMDMSFDEKVFFGRKALKLLADFLSEYGYTDEDNFTLIINLIKYFVSMDYECSYDEYEMIKAILDIEMDYIEFYNATNGGADENFVSMMEKVISIFSEEERIMICSLGLIIILCDGELNENEMEMFLRLCQ